MSLTNLDISTETSEPNQSQKAKLVRQFSTCREPSVKNLEEEKSSTNNFDEVFQGKSSTNNLNEMFQENSTTNKLSEIFQEKLLTDNLNEVFKEKLSAKKFKKMFQSQSENWPPSEEQVCFLCLL